MFIRRALCFCLSTIFVFFLFTVHAVAGEKQDISKTVAQSTEQDRIQQIEEKIKELTQELETLKKTVQAQAPAKPPEAPEWFRNINLNGVGYISYTYDSSAGKNDFNEFNLNRVYLNVESKLWEKGKIKYTLEGGDIRDSGTKQFNTVTKHLYIQDDDLITKGDYFQFGLLDLPWVPYEEGIWNYRFQGTVFPDRSGYLTSTDLGIGYGWKFPDSRGSMQFNFVNGEGWKSRELGAHKDAHMRLTLNPLPNRNFFIAGFASLGTYDDPALPATETHERNRYIGQIGYKEKDRLTLVGEYLWALDPRTEMMAKYPSLKVPTAGPRPLAQAEGYSIFATVNMSLFSQDESAKSWELVGRWDHLDPDIGIANNNVDRLIGGIAYKFNSWYRVLVDYEQVKEGSGAKLLNEYRTMLNSEVKF